MSDMRDRDGHGGRSRDILDMDPRRSLSPRIPAAIRGRDRSRTPTRGSGGGHHRSSSRSRSRSVNRKYTRYRSSDRSRRADRSFSRSPRRRGYEGGSRSGGGGYGGRSSNGRSSLMQDPPPPNKCLGIFGLSLRTTERDLRDVFTRYGPIEECTVVIDAQTGRSRGFSFIYFESIDDAKSAKESCNGIEIDGRRIRVDFSITQRAHTPTPGIYMGKVNSQSSNRRRPYNNSYNGNYRDSRRGGDDRGYRQDRREDRREEYRYKSHRSPSPYYGSRKRVSRSPFSPGRTSKYY